MYFLLVLMMIVSLLFVYACRSDKGPNTQHFRGKVGQNNSLLSLLQWFARRAL